MSAGGSLGLLELAADLGAELRGAAELRLTGLRTLAAAGPADLSFLTSASYRQAGMASAAGALLIPASLGAWQEFERPLLVVDDVSLTLARLIEIFHPPTAVRPGIHPTAVVAADCQVSSSAQIGAYAVLGAGCKVGAGAVIYPHVVLGQRCRIAAEVVIHPSAVLYDGTEIGVGSIIHAGAVIGADGFGYATSAGQHIKIPQVGTAVLEEQVEIGANSAIDRAMLEETRIGAGSKIDNLVQIGHNARLGKGCVLSGQAGVSGSARLGDYVVMGGQSGTAGHFDIGDGVQIAAKSAVLQEVAAGSKVAGIPAVDLRSWRRQALSWGKIGELLQRVRALERRLRGAESVAEEESRRSAERNA